MADRVKIPRDLADHGRRLYRAVVQDASHNGLELTPIEQFWLHSACDLTDQAAEIKCALQSAPLYMKGSQGQEVANPLIGELRQLHLAVNLTLARIRVDLPEVTGIAGLNQPRRAAHIRWRGAGA